MISWLLAGLSRKYDINDLARDYAGFYATRSGVTVTEDTAMRQSAVYSCVKVLAESIGQLPLQLLEKRGRNISPVEQHSVSAMLSGRMNVLQTPAEFFEAEQAHECLRGQFFAKLIRFGKDIAELMPLDARAVTPIFERGALKYRYVSSEGVQEFQERDVLHLKHFSLDGMNGVSPITYHRETIGLGLAALNHGASFFGKAARPSGVLLHPGNLSKTARDNLAVEWQTRFGGDNVASVAVLEEGMKWEKLTVSNEDAEYIETRKFSRAEIAGLYRVPPHMIGDLERATFSNIEHQRMEFVTSSLGPWLRKKEQRLALTLLSSEERERGLYFKFNLDAFLRGDTITRYKAHQIGVQTGFLNRNEAREIEDRNPVEGLDEFLSPLNLGGNNTPGPNEDDDDPKPPPPTVEPPKGEQQ